MVMAAKEGKVGKPPFNGLEQRRTIRIRRSALVRDNLDSIDRPSIKIGETLDELKQAFRIVYTEYNDAGYVPNPEPTGMLYSVHSLLPTTSVFIFKTYLKVISTMSLYKDTRVFGLPMDAVYKPEIDALRAKGRQVAEVGALATPKSRRGANLVVYLAKALFNYAHLVELDDVCIMVNPKHVRFYKEIFLFDQLAEERMYAGVGAPAVALHADVHTYDQRMRDAYGDADFDTDLLSFFVKMKNAVMDPSMKYSVGNDKPLEQSTVQYFLDQRPHVLSGMNEEQLQVLAYLYPQAIGGKGKIGH